MLAAPVRLILWLSLAFAGAANAVGESRFHVSSVSETRFEDAPALSLRLTRAIDPATDLGLYVRVTPAPADGSGWLADGDGRHWILPFVEPATEYRVRVERPLVAIDGQSLQNVTLDKAGSPGPSSDWTLRTRELAPGAFFASRGSYLVGPIQNAIPVTVVNLQAVELDVFRIRDADQERFLSETVYQGRVYNGSLNQLRQYADLVRTARFPTAGRANQRHTLNLNLEPVLTPEATGIYIAVLRQPGVYDYSHDTLVFTVSDIGLHLRKYRQSVAVYAHSITTAEALGGLDLSFWWPAEERRPARGLDVRTGPDGAYQLSGEAPPALVLARRGRQISFLRLDRNALDLSAFANATTRHRELQGFLYGPRALYRPGDEVAINLLLRDYDGRSVPPLPVRAVIHDAHGQIHSRFTWQPDGTGIYRHRFELGRGAAVGEWRLQIGIDGTDLDDVYRFQVETFLPERLGLTFFDGDRAAQRFAASAEVKVPVQADYLYGAPAAGNKLDAVVTVKPAVRLFDQHPDFHFGDGEAKLRPASVQLPAIALAADGSGMLEVPDLWPGVAVPTRYRISASVYEAGGRPVTRTQDVIRLPAAPLPGVKALFEGRADTDAELAFELLSVDLQGRAVADDLAVRLIRDHREYFWEYDENRGWYWSQQSDRYIAAATTVRTGADPTRLQLPVEWGDYELEVRSSASGMVTVYRFQTEYRGHDLAGRGAASLKPDTILLDFDRDSYAPGDPLTLHLQAPIAGEALINIESSDGVVYSDRFIARRGANEFSMSIPTHWDRHDYHASVMILAPADQVSELSPGRAIGIAHLPLVREDARLQVRIEAPATTESQRAVGARVVVENPEAAGGQSLFATFALVDTGILNISDYRRPRPESHFFAPRRFEADYHDVYSRIIENLGHATALERFGGGAEDSADDLSRGGEQPGSEVQILSFFSAPVQLRQGQAEISFDLPAFNGRAKWMVVVYGERSYASAEAEIRIADRLVSQISMPRFIAPGDRSQVVLDLHNLSGGAQSLTVELSFSRPLQAEPLRRQLILQDREKADLIVPVDGGEREGIGQIRLRITSEGDIELERQWSLGVRSAWPRATRYLRQSIAPGEVWRPLPDLSGLRAGSLRALLSLSDRPPIDYAAHLQQLLAYPYGCLEQTASATYPWLLFDPDLAGRLGLRGLIESGGDSPSWAESRVRRIREGIGGLLDMQLDSGGFGEWDGRGQESPWASVYATEILVAARDFGLAVDQAAMQSALERLATYLRGDDGPSGWSESEEYAQFAYRAYAGYVLARAGVVSLSQLRRLYEQSLLRDLNQSGLAWMHLAAALHLSQDVNRARAAAVRGLNTTRQTNRYYRDYGSTLRDAAMTLSLALDHGFEPVGLGERVADLVHSRSWFSTQERIALLRLARHYGQAGTGWQAFVLLADGEREALASERPFSRLLEGRKIADIVGIEAGAQRLHASVVYNGLPLRRPAAYSHGLQIRRQYFDLQGQVRTLDGIDSGELIVVRLSVQTGAQPIPQALVVDLLPAGLELENPNLAQAGLGLDQISIGQDNLGDRLRSRQTRFEEYRDDRFVAAIDLPADAQTSLFYLARAVTPGVYRVPMPYVEDMYRPRFQALGESPERLTVRAR